MELAQHSLQEAFKCADLPLCVMWAHDVAKAMAYLHLNSVLHHDLKTDNVRVSDFHLSHSTHRTVRAHHANTQLIFVRH